MGTNGFLGGLLGRDAHEDDDPGTHHPGEEIETTRRRSRRGASPQEGHHQPPRGLTVEGLAGAIADLPPAVPRESAVLIVRKTLDFEEQGLLDTLRHLEAAGIRYAGAAHNREVVSKTRLGTPEVLAFTM